MQSFGSTICDGRRKNGLTVRALAEKLGVTPGYVSRIETRDEIPSPELICELAEALELNPKRLLDLARSSKVADVNRTLAARHEEALHLFRRSK